MDFIGKIVNSSTFYYCLIGIVYVLCIVFVVMLLVKNKRKKHIEPKVEQKKDLSSIDLESVLEKMQEDSSKTKDEIMTFEEEQEEKAIISYQELLNAVKKNVNSVTEVKETQNDNINKEEIKLTVESVLEPEVLKQDDKPKTVLKEESKQTKFQNSEFISPIYGRVNNEMDYPTIKSFDEKNEEDLEKTIVMPKVNSKYDDNDEFLKLLKEFRNNLE
ncbi:MAG: hypothetical protein E7165_00285 [Firmicutes bacterium]|nr:hypothetical protein [Bacillota bacterium]